MCQRDAARERYQAEVDRESAQFLIDMAAWRELHGLSRGSRGKLYEFPKTPGADAAHDTQVDGSAEETSIDQAATDGVARTDANVGQRTGIGIDCAPKKPLRAYALW